MSVIEKIRSLFGGAPTQSATRDARVAPQDQINLLEPRDAFPLVRAGTLTLIDVRRPEEWNETGRPAKSRGVMLQDPDFVAKVDAILGSKSEPVAVSCRSGARSAKAAGILASAGFSDISDIKGGFSAWRDQGMPVDMPPFAD